MDNKIISKKFNIVSLAPSYVASYLQQFSETVREALRVTSIHAEHEYLQAALEKQAKGETHFYLIITDQSQQVIGAVEIRQPEQSRGQLYTWLNESYWGRGIFQHMIREVAADYFAQTHKPYFDATVETNNQRSYRALKKAGFADLGIQEGAWEKNYVLILRNKNTTPY
ncbi:GNAT family N-acetyltransferase [Candidatus Dependentiae bacterium]|nr:GNAT family N-acetyltransferase [Candidatus Dependentiae bacterium]